MHEGNPVLNIKIGANGASTARLYIFVKCALLQSLFQQNQTNVSYREFARLIARNSLKCWGQSEKIGGNTLIVRTRLALKHL